MPTVAKDVDVQGLNPDLKTRLFALIGAVESQGGRVTVTSGYRTVEKQREIVASGNNGIPAAKPGQSRHNYGLAADVDGDAKTMKMLHNMAPQFGLNFPLKEKDRFHVQLLDGPITPFTPTGAGAAPQGPTAVPLGDRLNVLEKMINPAGLKLDTNDGDVSQETGVAPEAPAVQTMATATQTGTASGQYGAIINAAAQRYGIDARLVEAVIQAESGGRANAASPAGAQGLMQLMPATARSLGVKNPLDPAQNIEGGVKYLAQQLKSFGGDVSKALAAYNAGPGAVQKYGGIPPYKETQNYVNRILKNYQGGK